MTYLVQASPLSKIFLKEHQAKCFDDPAYILNGDPFVVRIPRSVGAIELVHNKPVVGSSLISTVMQDADKSVKPWRRRVEDDEVTPLVNWLTDERNHETDIYGVVAVPIENNVADAITAMIMGEDKASTINKLITEVRKKMAVDIEDARRRADARVARQCDKMYRVVLDTVNYLKKTNQGQYSPSWAEALAAGIIQHEYASKRAYDEKAAALFNQNMQRREGVPVGQPQATAPVETPAT